ncbi:hypothetical protein IX91_21875 [Vibrio tubiashii ATCC 19109]|uniref:Uncharacterized protein n=1 Tax=Vibrio tubiashii ATCC 19109 TaxID=1051646 RepID=A0A0A0SP28_9VIBR|nr:hypothetical protein IX91_21875 [Vibrio tubiashii ATCC 19109]
MNKNYTKILISGKNCDEIQFFLAFFVLLGNNPPPHIGGPLLFIEFLDERTVNNTNISYVPSGLMRFTTFPHLNGISSQLDWYWNW